jgi:CheY-like chemotaxis protein
MRKVLVVDDITVNSKILVMHLSKFGIACDTVTNGQEAVSACTRTRYQIILMDLDMPVMDGFEATRLIRQYEKTLGVHTPILAVTSFDRPETSQRCIRAGMDGLINKGLSADELMASIDRYSLEDTATRSPTAAAVRHTKEQTDFQTDLDQLAGRFEGQLSEVFGEFFFLARGMRDQFEQAIAARNSMDLTHVAYSLKGCCSSLGLATMASLCAEVADDGYAGRWNQVAAKYRRLVDMLGEVQDHFSTLSSTTSA